MGWFWNRNKRTGGTLITCLAPGAPGHAGDQVGPEEPLSPKNPVATLVGLLFQEAKTRNADTIELEPDRSRDCLRVRLKGPGDWEHTPSLPGWSWAGLVFVCLRGCVIESCEGVLKDPASGECWRFTFRQQGQQIRFSKLAPTPSHS
jgi:hypothetical protein